MIYSLLQIDFIETASGGSTRLLDIGDQVAEELALPIEAGSYGYTPIGAAWGLSQPGGGARRTLEWTRRVEHASHVAAATYSIGHPALLPFAKAGKLRITISGGAVWDLHDAVLLGATAPRDVRGQFATLNRYRAEAGRTQIVSGLPLTAGVPFAWWVESFSSITTAFQDL